MTHQDITKTIRDIRATIPLCNLQHFDAGAEFLIAELKRNPERFTELTAWFWERVKIMRVVDISSTPPDLAKRVGEGHIEWLDRCFAAGGYFNGVNS